MDSRKKEKEKRREAASIYEKYRSGVPWEDLKRR